MFPGLIAPKVSWVILLSGPTGVMSVSPVARAETTTRKKVAISAITPIHHLMWNSECPSSTAAVPSTMKPPMNHDPGTSIFSIGSSRPALRLRNAVIVPKARTTVFQFMKNSSSPEVTIMGTPIHRLHDEIRRNADPPVLAMTPASIIIGASTT